MCCNKDPEQPKQRILNKTKTIHCYQIYSVLMNLTLDTIIQEGGGDSEMKKKKIRNLNLQISEYNVFMYECSQISSRPVSAQSN